MSSDNSNLAAYVRKEYGWAYRFHGDKATHALCVNNVAQCLASAFQGCEDGFDGDLWQAVDEHVDWFALATVLVDKYVPMKLNH